MKYWSTDDRHGGEEVRGGWGRWRGMVGVDDWDDDVGDGWMDGVGVDNVTGDNIGQ